MNKEAEALALSKFENEWCILRDQFARAQALSADRWRQGEIDSEEAREYFDEDFHTLVAGARRLKERMRIAIGACPDEELSP